jgi:hypothetical protein
MRVTVQNAQRYIGWLALFLAVAVAVLGFVDQTERTNLANRVAAQSACQTKVNQEFLAVIKDRANISNENTANLNNFIVAFLHSKNNTPAQDTAVIDAYLTELAKINGELKRATFPSIGSC